MRVLVACEYSGVVRRAFREVGHDAWSCDILPAEDSSPYHFQDDIFAVLEMGHHWDLMIAHPPCTYLCNAGVRWLFDKEGNAVWSRHENLYIAREFFMRLWETPIPKIAIENPIPHKYAQLPKFTQTIQPYQFGVNRSKRTCLWLKGLPPLQVPPTEEWAAPRIEYDKNGQPHKVYGTDKWSDTAGKVIQMDARTKTRGLERSRTDERIGEAFARNWG